MVRHAKSPKSSRKNKKTLKAKKNSTKRLRKNKKTRRNVKKHRRYGGAPPTDKKAMPQKVEEEEECAICQEKHELKLIVDIHSIKSVWVFGVINEHQILTKHVQFVEQISHLFVKTLNRLIVLVL